MDAVAVDRKSPRKLYCQLLEILKQPIECGEWKAGAQIPTEAQLCGRYRVSKTTVRSAIEELVALGHLCKVQGKGTFVRRTIPEESIRMAICLNAERLEFSAAHRYEAVSEATSQPETLIADYLNLAPEETCWNLARVLVLDGAPLAMEHLFLPSRLCVGDLGGRSAVLPLTSCLEQRCALKIQRLREKTDIRYAGAREAALLNIPPRSPVMRIRQFFYRAGDQPAGFASTIRRIDRFGRILEFERL